MPRRSTALTGSTADEAFRFAVQTHQAILDDRVGKGAQSIGKSQRQLKEALASVREGGDLNELLKLERLILKDEAERLTTSGPMAGSLSAAIEELDHAVAMLPRVRDPERYAEVAATHLHRKRRIGGLPRDDARMFFSAHGARLLNLMKAPLPHASQAVLSERRRNLRTAEKMYKGLQLQALGIRSARSAPEHSLSR